MLIGYKPVWVMRVAIVSEVFMPAVDGVVTRLQHTLEELQRAGDDVVMIAPAGGPDSYAGFPVIGVREISMPLYPDGDGYPPKRVALPGPALSRALERHRPDVVHTINPVLLGAGAVAIARRRGWPVVASYHAHLPTYAHLYRCGWLEPAVWRYIRVLHNLAELNLCTSRATLETLRQHGIERLELWPYGIETERFHPSKADDRWRWRLSGGRPERVILLFVGRLAKEKTVERLLEAVAGRDDVALAIVGDGPLRSRLEGTFAGTPTTFLGFLHGEELASAYASADVFVFPSETETLGLVTLEAQASGLPVIAADSPAARELVAHGVNGLRYSPATAGALRDAVRVLVREPELRRRMARAGRASVGTAGWRHATDTLRSWYGAVSRPAQRGLTQVAASADGYAERRDIA